MRLDDTDKQILGKIVREALNAAIEGKPYAPPKSDRPALLEKRGCFVTLKTRGQLRGCIGCFTSRDPLYQTVAAYAAHSALEDPRFVNNRLKQSELPTVEVEISALTPLEPCADPEKIIPGVHGIYVSRSGRSGCFLPQVAEEMHWNAEQFWSHCCRDKAGLDHNAWRDPATSLMTFTAEVFEC